MAGGGRRRGILLSAAAAIVIAIIYVLLRQRNAPDLLVQSDEGWQPDVRVAVGGEVVNPGTYTLRGDARLADLVTVAGGYTDRAERTALNPAARVGDGMEYIIPTQAPRASTGTARPAPSPATPPSAPEKLTPQTAVPTPARPATVSAGAAAKLDINAATREELEALPLIGPAIAQRIVDDRTANGPYKQIEDLARVRGISARTVDQLRDRITVGP